MTTIDIKLDMSGEGNRPQELIYVRISKDDGGHRSDGETNRLPNVSPSRVPKRGGKSPSARRNAARSFDVVESQMAHLNQLNTYDARMFTITAYLPNQGMKGEKRLKVSLCATSGYRVELVWCRSLESVFLLFIVKCMEKIQRQFLSKFLCLVESRR